MSSTTLANSGYPRGITIINIRYTFSTVRLGGVDLAAAVPYSAAMAFLKKEKKQMEQEGENGEMPRERSIHTIKTCSLKGLKTKHQLVASQARQYEYVVFQY